MNYCYGYELGLIVVEKMRYLWAEEGDLVVCYERRGFGNRMGGLGRKGSGLKVGSALWVMVVIFVKECRVG